MILISSADSELNPPGWFPINVASGQVEQKHKKIQSPQYLSRKVPPSTLVPPSLPPSSSLPLPSSTPALRQDEQLQNKLLRIPLIPDHTGSPMSRHRKDQEVKGGRECVPGPTAAHAITRETMTTYDTARDLGKGPEPAASHDQLEAPAKLSKLEFRQKDVC